MLLFEDTKKLEKAIGEEAAGIIIKILEAQDEAAKKELATKADLEKTEFVLKTELRETELRLTAEILRLKNDLTVRMGAMLAATLAVIAALKMFG